MKAYRKISALILAGAIATACWAQSDQTGGVRKRSDKTKKQEQTGPKVTDRMQDFFENKATHDADLSYMRMIYRQLDLSKDANQALYYPEDVVDGQENLFRVIMKLVVEGKVPAYEYLDGREVFTDQYKVDPGDMLNRFGIYYTQGSGSGRQPKYVVEEADVPTGQVQNYYIMEKWEFDRRSNMMKTRVEAICPVLNRSGDFGGEARYPMFWVKFDALRPYLAQQYVFLTDDNNLPQYSLDDYFNMGMYDGEIYKTRNLRNLSMSQMYPDPDDMKRAQDSIDRRLKEFGKNLWVPSREEYLAQKEQEAGKAKAVAAADTLPERTVVGEASAEKTNSRASARKRTAKRKVSKPKVSSASSSSSQGNSGAAKSVRRRRR